VDEHREHVEPIREFADDDGGDFMKEQEDEDAELPHFRNAMDTLYVNHHIYLESKYIDGGMYYEDFLRLLGKSSAFGDHGRYSTMAQNLCVCVIKLCRMIYPHILEDFHFHLERPAEGETTRGLSRETLRPRSEAAEDVVSGNGIQVFRPKMDEF
jgi:hypothetical protein